MQHAASLTSRRDQQPADNAPTFPAPVTAQLSGSDPGVEDTCVQPEHGHPRTLPDDPRVLLIRGLGSSPRRRFEPLSHLR
jgi:hypothetical protein